MDVSSDLIGKHPGIMQASGKSKPILVVDGDWHRILAMSIPESCVIHTSLSSLIHSEAVEIRISSFTRSTRFVECTVMSWPCCAGSDLADQLQAQIQNFYNTHFTPGQWLNHGFVETAAFVAPK